MKQNVQFQVGIYYDKIQLDQIQNDRLAATSDRQIFSLTRFTQHFFMYGSKLYTIYISIPLIAWMSSKFGNIQTETRSWQPKWLIIRHYLF